MGLISLTRAWLTSRGPQKAETLNQNFEYLESLVPPGGLELISKAEAEAGTSEIPRAWSAKRIAEAIAALTPP